MKETMSYSQKLNACVRQNRARRSRSVIGVLLVVLTVCGIGRDAQAQYRTVQPVLGSGGGTLHGGQYQTRITIGQHLVGSVNGEAYSAASGFWTVYRGMLAVGTAMEDGASDRPVKIGLEQNFPNPFNPSTRIRYHLPNATYARLVVHDILGREVITLVNGQRASGTFDVLWDGRDAAGGAVASGLYLYRLETPEFIRVRTMTLVK